MKLLNISLISFKKNSFGLGSDKNKWFKLESKRDFIIVIFPKGVRFLRFQYFIFVLMLESLSEKFRVSILVRSVSNVIPNSLNMLTPHCNFHLVFIESVLYFLEPIHSTCVLEKLTLSPDFLANSSSSFNVSFRESSEPSNITVVSSAYCVRTKSLLLIFIPLIFSLFLIFMANISAQSINIYGEIGSPCLHPRSVLKKEERLPLD